MAATDKSMYPVDTMGPRRFDAENWHDFQPMIQFHDRTTTPLRIASMPTGTTDSHSKHLSTGVTVWRWARIILDGPSVPILDRLRLLSDMMRLFATPYSCATLDHEVVRCHPCVYSCEDKPPGTPNETRNE